MWFQNLDQNVMAQRAANKLALHHPLAIRKRVAFCLRRLKQGFAQDTSLMCVYARHFHFQPENLQIRLVHFLCQPIDLGYSSIIKSLSLACLDSPDRLFINASVVVLKSRNPMSWRFFVTTQRIRGASLLLLFLDSRRWLHKLLQGGGYCSHGSSYCGYHSRSNKRDSNSSWQCCWRRRNGKYWLPMLEIVR